MADDDGWIVKGGPKKKAPQTPTKGPSAPLRTAESANKPVSLPKKTTTSPAAHGQARGKAPKPKPTFEHREDETVFNYETAPSWTVPAPVFQKLIAKYPGLTTLDHTDYSSRWTFMRQMENAHWHYTDDLVGELAHLNLKPVSASDFFAGMLHELSKQGVKPTYSPSRYTDEWQYWQKHCRVGTLALAKQDENQQWCLLMVKTLSSWYSEVSTAFVGSKAEVNDTTFWGLVTRELKDKLGFEATEEDEKKVSLSIEGPRAVTFVLPLASDDPRLAALTPKSADIHSLIWVPVHATDLTRVKEPARENKSTPSTPSTPAASPANSAPVTPSSSGFIPIPTSPVSKDDPSDLRMTWEVKENFKKLQLYSTFENKQDGLQDVLKRDPRSYTVSEK